MPHRTPSTARNITAFLAVYLIWGSTYLAIRFAIESIPPVFMAAVRFLIAGLLLYVWARGRGAARPHSSHLLPSAIVGTLMLVFGNLGIVLAEKTVPSGLVSLLVAMVPVYVVILAWLRPNGEAPSRRVIVGLLVGILGMIFLIGPSKLTGGHGLDLAGVAYVMFGSLCWSAGTLYSRSMRWPDSPLLATAMQMLAAGGVLAIISMCLGEPAHLNMSAFTMRSIFSLAYLISFGSIIAFSAYVWLLKVVPPSRVATYAYVNPVVAVFLGWAMAGEKISTQTVVAAGVILSAVWIISSATHSKKPVMIAD